MGPTRPQVRRRRGREGNGGSRRGLRLAPRRTDRHFPQPHGPRPGRRREERGVGRADVQAPAAAGGGHVSALLSPLPGPASFPTGAGGAGAGGAAALAEQRDPPSPPPSRSSIRGASLCSAAAAMMLRRLPLSAPPPRGAAPPGGDGAAAGACRPGRGSHAVLGRRRRWHPPAPSPRAIAVAPGFFKGRRAAGVSPAAAGRAQHSPSSCRRVAPASVTHVLLPVTPRRGAGRPIHPPHRAELSPRAGWALPGRRERPATAHSSPGAGDRQCSGNPGFTEKIPAKRRLRRWFFFARNRPFKRFWGFLFFFRWRVPGYAISVDILSSVNYLAFLQVCCSWQIRLATFQLNCC